MSPSDTVIEQSPLETASEKVPSKPSSPLEENAYYVRRKGMFDMDSKKVIKNVAESSPNCIFLDVRAPVELDVAQLERYPFINIQCTMENTSELEERANKLFPDKDAPIIAFCRVGGRSGKAKMILKSMGYTQVYNAGGLMDMGYL